MLGDVLRNVSTCGAAADAGPSSAGGVGVAPRQEGLLLAGRRRREPVHRCRSFRSGGTGDSSTAVRECLGVELHRFRGPRLKLSSIVDQGDDTETGGASARQVSACYQQTVMEGPPQKEEEEEEPSATGLAYWATRRSASQALFEENAQGGGRRTLVVKGACGRSNPCGFGGVSSQNARSCSAVRRWRASLRQFCGARPESPDLKQWRAPWRTTCGPSGWRAAEDPEKSVLSGIEVPIESHGVEEKEE